MPTGDGPARLVSLSAVTVDETIGRPFDASGYPYVTFWIKGTGTTSSGVITLEEADYDFQTDGQYTGTWSPITTVNASDVTGGAQKAVHVTGNSHWIRPRISTVIGGGGSITVVITANGAS